MKVTSKTTFFSIAGLVVLLSAFVSVFGITDAALFDTNEQQATINVVADSDEFIQTESTFFNSGHSNSSRNSEESPEWIEDSEDEDEDEKQSFEFLAVHGADKIQPKPASITHNPDALSKYIFTESVPRYIRYCSIKIHFIA
jgi:hypothetical protein